MQAAEVEQDVLCPAHGERGDHDTAALPPGISENLTQLRQGILFAPVFSIAIGRLHQYHVGGRELGRRIHQYRVALAEVAGKHQNLILSLFLQVNLDDRRTQNVTGVVEADRAGKS